MSVKVKEGAEGGILGAVGKKNSNLNMFGSSHNVVGESSSDLILRTRGKIKILWGNKFIDLLKDGKLNVNSDFIFKVADKDSIKNKTGVYVTDNGEVYLKYSSDEPLNLQGEIGTSYVSFLAPQETTSDNKYTALKNIGLIYSSLEEVDEKSLQNGIIYVEDVSKIYIVKDGQLTEFNVSVPNPFTEQFVVSKNDSDLGAINIIGKGINNSLAFDLFYIYDNNSESVIESKIPIKLIYNRNSIILDSDKVSFSNPIITNSILSLNASSTNGFRLYTMGSNSILEVDQVVERNSTKNSIALYPEYWLLENNVILSISSDSGIVTLNLLYKHHYLIGDILKFYIKEEKVVENSEEIEPESLEESGFTEYQIEISEVQDEYTIKTENSDLPEIISNIQIFLVHSSDKNPIRIIDNNVDIIEYSDDLLLNSRFGNLSELELKRKDNNSENTAIVGSGIYSKCGIFKEAQYTEDYVLILDDNSSRFASTEWVNTLQYATKLYVDDKLKALDSIPIGAIIMYNGNLEIPENWVICDGTNDTPDLSDTLNENIIYIMKIK